VPLDWLTNQHDNAERARHVAVIDASMDAVVAVDQEGNIVMLNPIAEVLFQWRERDITGFAFQQLISEPFRSEFTSLLILSLMARNCLRSL